MTKPRPKHQDTARGPGTAAARTTPADSSVYTQQESGASGNRPPTPEELAGADNASRNTVEGSANTSADREDRE